MEDPAHPTLPLLCQGWELVRPCLCSQRIYIILISLVLRILFDLTIEAERVGFFDLHTGIIRFLQSFEQLIPQLIDMGPGLFALFQFHDCNVLL